MHPASFLTAIGGFSIPQNRSKRIIVSSFFTIVFDILIDLQNLIFISFDTCSGFVRYQVTVLTFIIIAVLREISIDPLGSAIRAGLLVLLIKVIQKVIKRFTCRLLQKAAYPHALLGQCALGIMNHKISVSFTQPIHELPIACAIYFFPAQ